MKTYTVHFSFYSEENGNFDESFYKVEAENPFEARRLAWTLRDTDDDARFQSCVRQCGVTWEASPLDLCDYLNALAAGDKCRLRQITNIDIPNAALRKNGEKKEEARWQRAYYRGSLDVLCLIARDMGKPLGMEPPDVFEELAYAWLLVGKLDEAGSHEKAAALAQRIERAQKWDATAILGLKELFDSGCTMLNGETVNLSEHFGRDSVYPERADLNDCFFSSYILRWERVRRVDTLSRLPVYGERDVIMGSAEYMPLDYKTLVLRPERLAPEYRKPENILWTPHYDLDGSCLNLENGSPDTRFNAENMITGVVVALRRKDFFGVLRPEYANNIGFEALKQEYAAQHTQADEDESAEFDGFDADEEDDWEMEED